MKRTMWKWIVLIVSVTIYLIAGKTALADSVSLSEDTSESAGTAARWYVNMPKTGTNTLTITADDLVAGKDTFKVYDDGGKGGDNTYTNSPGNYSDNCNGVLIIAAPANYVIQVSGCLLTQKGKNSDYLDIYDNYTTSGEKLVNQACSVITGWFDIGSVLSSSQYVTLNFISNDSWNYNGLDLTVEIIDNRAYGISISDVASGSISVAVDGKTSLQASYGDTVTLTATPASGYKLSDISVVNNESGEIIRVVGGDFISNTATFTMPTAAVTVIPTFTQTMTAEGGLAINMPASGNWARTIPTGIYSFKVYDDGGPTGKYSNSCDSSLTLTAPEGWVLMVTGSITTNVADAFYVFDGTNVLTYNSAINTVRRSERDNIPIDIGTLVSENKSLTIQFRGASNARDGLDLTVTVINRQIDYTVTVNSPAEGCAISATPVSAKYGNTITVSKTAMADGYLLDGISVSAANGQAVTVTNNPRWYSGTNPVDATFIMPSANATVTPNFTNDLTVSGGLNVWMPEMTGDTAVSKSITIPTGVRSFKVYDDGGPNKNYSYKYNGTLTLTAPSGMRLQVSGTITTGREDHYLTIYDGAAANSSTLVTRTSSSANEQALSILSPTSTGESITISFSANGGNNSAGLNLAVTVIDPSRSYTITKGNATGGTISITANGNELTQATAGTTVTVKGTADAGYVFNGIHVVENSGEHDVSSTGAWYTDNEATFIIPNADVTVTPIFSVGDYAVNMLKNGSLSISVPAGVSTVRIYDDGGPNGYPGLGGTSDWLTLTSPEGSVIRITGEIKMGASVGDGWLTVYDSDGNTKLIDMKNILYNVDVVSTGCSMTLHSMCNAKISTLAGSGFELTATVGHHIVTATGLMGGNISADKSFAADGEAVTLTVTPDEGYTIGTVTYNDGSEHVIEPVDNIYTFSTTASSTASTVNVTATFRKALTHMDISIEEIPSQTYTGSALTPVVIVKDGTKTLKEDTDYTISPKTYTDAGEHSITITGIGNYSSVVEKTFTVNPVSVTLIANSRDTDIYDGTEKAVTGFACSVEGLTFAETVCAIGSGTDAGDYDVTFSGVTVNDTKDSTENYLVTSTTDGILTIKKASGLTVRLADVSYTYDGMAKAITSNPTTNAAGGTTTYIYSFEENGNYVSDLSSLTKTDAGSYIVYVKATNPNYNNEATTTAKLTISKASDLTVSLEGSSYTFDGTAKAISNNPTTNAAGGMTTYTYSFEETGTYVSDLNSLTKTDAGSYTVYVKGTNPNYSNEATTTAKLSIAAKSVTITGLSTEDKVYDGSTTATVTGTANVDGKVGSDDVSVKTGSAAFIDKNVGNGKAVIFSDWSLTGTAAGNYELSGQPASVSANITACPVTISGITATGRTYDPTNLAAVLTGGTVTGAVADDMVNMDISNAKGTMADADAGENKPVTVTGVTLTGADAGNYSLTQPSGVTVTISKANNPMTVMPTAVVKIGGNTVDLSGNISRAEGNVTYAITGTLEGCSIDENTGVLTSGTETGTCTVTVTAAGNRNYESGTAEITVTVTDKDTQTMAFAERSVTKTYGDAAFVNALSGAKTKVTYAVTAGADVASVTADNTVTILKAGTATITATAEETPAIAGSTASYTLTVNKAKLNVTAPKPVENLVYTGAEIELITAGSEENDAGILYYAVTTDQNEPAADKYTSTIPKKTEVGAYYVWYMAKAMDGNHEDSSVCGPIEVSVAENEQGQGQQQPGGEEGQQGGEQPGGEEGQQGGEQPSGEEGQGQQQGGEQTGGNEGQGQQQQPGNEQGQQQSEQQQQPGGNEGQGQQQQSGNEQSQQQGDQQPTPTVVTEAGKSYSSVTEAIQETVNMPITVTSETTIGSGENAITIKQGSTITAAEPEKNGNTTVQQLTITTGSQETTTAYLVKSGETTTAIPSNIIKTDADSVENATAPEQLVNIAKVLGKVSETAGVSADKITGVEIGAQIETVSVSTNETGKSVLTYEVDPVALVRQSGQEGETSVLLDNSDLAKDAVFVFRLDVTGIAKQTGDQIEAKHLGKNEEIVDQKTYPVQAGENGSLFIEVSTSSFSRWELTLVDPADQKEGTIPQEPITWRVLTIRYVYANGEKAADKYQNDIMEGSGFIITSPTIEHYQPDQEKVSGTMGSEDIDVTVTYAVVKTDPEVTPPQGKTLVWNQAEQELAMAGSAVGGTMEYALGEDGQTTPTEGWTGNVPSAYYVGTYYVWYQVMGDEYHNDTTPACVISNITLPALTVTSAGFAGEYDSKTHGITVKAEEEGVRITYATSENGEFTETAPAYTDAGVHTIYYRVEKDGYEPTTGHATVAIGKKVTVKMDEKELTVKEESGAITGVDSTMEYSLDNGKTWQAVEGEQITGLIGDEIKVLIRYAETANTHASEPITVVMTAKEASAPKKPDAAYTAKIQLEKKLLATPMAEKITVQWGKVDGAVKYRVYAEYAGQNEYELVKTTTGTSGSFRKLHKAKIKTSKRIKLYVVAYGKNWKMLAKSETIYVAGVNSKEYTNAKTVKVIDATTKATVRKIELNVKGMRQIRGYATPMAKGKTILGGSNGFRYVSSNPYVAKVNSSGRITAVGTGSCNVYVYAKNGLSAKVKVVVK